MIDQSQAQNLIGQQLHNREGDKIGKIGQIYVDDYHGEPEWLTVNTGLFGTRESFVPLAEAVLEGEDLVVPYTKTQIKDAPNIEDSSHLTEAEEQKLYAFYGIPYTTEGSTFADITRISGAPNAAQGTGDLQDISTRYKYAETSETNSEEKVSETRDPASTKHPDAYATDEDGTRYNESGAVTDGTVTDGAMTRSEEQLNVGTEQVQAGRARLRKWVQTENVQVEVPIRTEKAVLVTEPVSDDNRGEAFEGPGIGEEEHEIVLNTERPVVSKETVAKERVRLDTQVEETTQTVDQDVRKERIELQDDTDTETSTGGRHREP